MKRRSRAAREWAQVKAREARQLAAQTWHKAVQRGRLTARRIAQIQRDAGLNRKLVARSRQSVELRADKSDAEAAWRHGYLQQTTPQPPAPAVEADGPDTGWPPFSPWPWALPDPARPLTYTSMGTSEREAGE